MTNIDVIDVIDVDDGVSMEYEVYNHIIISINIIITLIIVFHVKLNYVYDDVLIH